MRGSHGVCDCDILRRANVKAELYLLLGGGFRPNPLISGVTTIGAGGAVAQPLFDG